MNPTVEHYQSVLIESEFGTYLKNSAYVSTMTTLISMFIALLAAYTLSRMSKTPGIRAIGIGMLIAQMTPVVMLIIPLYVFMMKANLLDTYASMIITYTTFTIPVVTWMLKSFFDSIPIDMEESAFIDGCTRFGVIFRIILPISLPALVATGLYAFVHAWSEFVLGYTFISDDSLRTLTPGLSLLMGLWTVDWGRLMAASVVIVVPVAIGFVYLQKLIIEGLTAGSTKG
ncbi:ABC-type glycerol-3-phosphate transport system permease component [Ammoniphilus resinae]|uniref:ABC-type glycerol-3-phosphate transport system permease component n=2 Tax=Ammoniphilus resinae TaxID=861532 RepID=A0ABS4GM73_9BACL|nr:ABC-type glycerol-3-phosphate transport system permease component [Ammoniphilus resinae]